MNDTAACHEPSWRKALKARKSSALQPVGALQILLKLMNGRLPLSSEGCAQVLRLCINGRLHGRGHRSSAHLRLLSI